MTLFVYTAKQRGGVYTDRQQVSLFGDLEEKPTGTKTFSEPLPCGNYMSIHGLIYCLEPVEGWVEVKYLRIDPGAKKNIADRAWVDPDTIRIACIQEHKELSEKIGHKITPTAWGFGPRANIDRHNYEMAGFIFVNPDDYYWLEEEFLQPKREKHNRRCEMMRSRNAAVQGNHDN